MGAPMAGHLIDAGHEVVVWNRTPAKAEPLRGRGAEVAKSPEDLATRCSLICTCVSRSEDVEEIVLRMAPAAARGTLFVDHSTIEPATARSIGKSLDEAGLAFMDAPLTGGEQGAIRGELTIFCGGPQDSFDRAEPVLGAYGKNVRLVGEVGSGQMMKMANQIGVALCVLGMSECLVFAQKAGLDLADAIELIGSGAGGSWSMTNYGPKVLTRDWSPGFAVELQQKDLAYALEAAREIGVSLPGTALTHQLFAALENSGRGGDATPALFEVIEKLSS